MIDLRTHYLGLELRSPLVPSASPLSEDLDKLERMQEAGAGAVVLPSIFEEQLQGESEDLFEHLTAGTESYAESLSYFPEPENLKVGPEHYLHHIMQAKARIDIPIIASLNGSSPGGWTRFARDIEAAGADALELNLYSIPSDPDLPAEAIEAYDLVTVGEVKQAVSIPVAVKVSPFYTNFANMAKKLDQRGADGLVLFNRFYQPDIDLETLEVNPGIHLSAPVEMRLPMRWIAMLYGRIAASLAATSGVHRGTDALKMLMAGADVTMLCSVLLRDGVEQIAVIEKQMVEWMETHEYESVSQLKGSMSQAHCPDPGAFERAQYTRAIGVERSILPDRTW